MEIEFRDRFMKLWQDHIGGAELPITFQYTDNGIQAEPAISSSQERCLMAMLRDVRGGRSLRFFVRSFGCSGGKFYSGYASVPREHFGELLSCGIDGQLRGERIKRDPDVAEEAVSRTPWYKAPAAHMVFKRWDKLDEHDSPDVVIFFAAPDVLSALCTLTGYDEPTFDNLVIAPMASGCASLIQYPYSEKLSGQHRAVIGMFDLTARPHIDRHDLSFAVTLERFQRMVSAMPESFLTAPVWMNIRKRIGERRGRGRRVIDMRNKRPA